MKTFYESTSRREVTVFTNNIKIYSRCEGTVGPPCFVQRGDTVLLEVDWVNPGVANMTQSTVDMPL